MRQLKEIMIYGWIVVFLFIIGWFDHIPELYLHTKDLCLQYFKEGILYSGQPYCAQGPISYAVGFLLSLILIDFDNSFYFFSLLVNLYFIYRIKIKETNDTSLVFFSFLYSLIYLKNNDFAIIVSTLFLVPGFYFLVYTPKKMLGSTFLAFALFSKAHTFFVIFPIIFFYFICLYKNYKSKILIIKSCFMVILPSVLLFFFFFFLYQDFLEYYIFAQGIQKTFPIFIVLIEFFSFKYSYNGLFLILYLAIFLTIIRLFNKKFDIFSFITGISFPIFFLKLFSSHDIFHGSQRFYYFLIFAPFYVLLLYKIKKEIIEYNKKTKMILFIGLLLFLVPLYQGLGGLRLDDLKDWTMFNDHKIVNKIQKEVSYPLFTLYTQGNILVSRDYTTIFPENTFLYLNVSQFTNIYQKYLPDPFAGKRPDITFASQLVTLDIVESLGPYDPRLYFNITNITKDLHNLSYSVIIGWPTHDDLTVVLIKNYDFFLSSYCDTSIPYLIDPYFPKESNNVMLISFLDKEECIRFREQIISYYQNNFEILCHRSKETAELVKESLRYNNFDFTETCTSYTKTANFISPPQIQEIYFAFFTVLFLIGVIYREFKRSKDRA